MKKLTVILGLVLVVCLLVPVSCAAPAPAPAPVPAPETTTYTAVWAKNQVSAYLNSLAKGTDAIRYLAELQSQGYFESRFSQSEVDQDLGGHKHSGWQVYYRLTDRPSKEYWDNLNWAVCKDGYVAEGSNGTLLVKADLMELSQSPTPSKEGHPESIKGLRWLTDAEKDRVIEIALNTPEAKEAREKYGVYRVGFGWVAIKNNESGGSDLWGFDYEMVDNIPENIPRDAEFYSRVEIYFGEPEQLLMRIAVDLDTEKAVRVDRHGLKILPK